jgi:hypothetical protein
LRVRKLRKLLKRKPPENEGSADRNYHVPGTISTLPNPIHILRSSKGCESSGLPEISRNPQHRPVFFVFFRPPHHQSSFHGTGAYQSYRVSLPTDQGKHGLTDLVPVFSQGLFNPWRYPGK